MKRILLISGLILLLFESCVNYRIQTNYELPRLSFDNDSFNGEIAIACRRKNIVIPCIVFFEGSIRGFQIITYIDTKDSTLRTIKIKDIRLSQNGVTIFNRNNVNLTEEYPLRKYDWKPNEFCGKYYTDFIIPKSIKSYETIDIEIKFLLYKNDGACVEIDYQNTMAKKKDKGLLTPV